MGGGGALPLKSRRHSDADKPKGKRPCKTKHTGLRDREKKKDGLALSSPGQHCSAEPGAPEEDKVRGPSNRSPALAGAVRLPLAAHSPYARQFL